MFVPQVKKSVTHVVHNAWRVDFNLSLPSFEKYIAGTRRLVDLCCSLPKPVKLLFTSSVAAAYKWDTSRGAVPEEVLSDTYVASANGYGASKFVAENVRLLTWAISFVAKYPLAAPCSCSGQRARDYFPADRTNLWT